MYTIVRHVIKPYEAIETKKGKEEYKKRHPEIEEIIQIVDEIYNNKQPKNLINAKAIKEWMEENNTKKPPSAYSEDKEEKKLGEALQYIRKRLIKPYRNLETEEQKQKFKNKHPELDEVMAIVEEISEDRQRIRLQKFEEEQKRMMRKKNAEPLQKLKTIKAWMEERNTMQPPKSTSQNVEERRLARSLSRIRNRLIKPYKALETDEEKEAFKKKHPDIEEVIAIVEELDKQRALDRAMRKMERAKQKKEAQISRHNKSTQDLGEESLDAQYNTQEKDAVDQSMNEQEREIRDSKDTTQNL